MRRRAISLNEMLDRFPAVLREVSNDLAYEISLKPGGKPAAILRPAFVAVVGTSLNEMQAKTHFKHLLKQMAANAHEPVRIQVLGGQPVDLTII